ncbi:5'-methylthioadenosine/S-adenosylhomocysteine nucleosidase family protein [Sorangium sp. KYC3313]|uniref:5'-methylthioadenosine/S-adenosylhomocysteine nucleosidase family protein n=1 Tax=Sorangium sp. KYC3313 TaxID=3449740 RepID=UPI003F8A2CD5
MNKSESLIRLQRQIDAIADVRRAGRGSPEFTKWHRHTAVVIGKIFGEDHENGERFNQISYTPAALGSRGTTQVFEQRFLNGLGDAQAVLESMIAEIKDFWSDTTFATAESPARSTAQDESAQSVHVVIICALHNPELDKLMRTSGTGWSRMPATTSDPHTYHTATVTTDAGTQLHILAAAPNQMGSAASAVLATKLTWRFRPRVVTMVGIAAGIRAGSQGFGDILAAEQTFDYQAGKLTSDGRKTEFQPDPRPIPISPRALAILKDWQRQRRNLDQIAAGWIAASPPTQLRLHVGPLATGPSVIDAKGPVEEILRHQRKVIGLEMEAYGVHCACREAIQPEPIFLCFKSICDFAHNKDDGWQDYAAYTASSFAWHFLRSEWENLVPNAG